jgi:hypothetical protein
MRTIYTLILVISALIVNAQDFAKNLSSAKSSYASGDLENARFSMQQMITDLDLLIGKDILKLLPMKMDAMASNSASDNVTANTGLAGVMIHRDYGTAQKTCSIEIMNNSPLISSMNAILAIPFMANSSDGTQKVIKLSGYKAILQKSVNTDDNTADFTLQVPLNSTLLTFSIPKSTEADALRLANTIPVADIAKKVE